MQVCVSRGNGGACGEIRGKGDGRKSKGEMGAAASRSVMDKGKWGAAEGMRGEIKADMQKVIRENAGGHSGLRSAGTGGNGYKLKFKI
jgi:hypothetical protein